MKYCIDYLPHKHNSLLLNEVNELKIIYNERDNTLLEFLEKYKDKRIIIQVYETDNFLNNKHYLQFNLIKEKYPQYSFTIMFTYSELINTFKNELNFPYCFDLRVNNWDSFLGLVQMQVSDIYIVEDLCFELDKVAEIAHLNNINIRTYANVAQTQWKDTDSLFTFFIRPEDIPIYEKYIDTLEFFGEKQEKVETYYKIYAKDKQWFGRLDEIIIGFNSDLDNKYIIPRFAEKRVLCNKQCLKSGKCRICHRIQDLSKSLEKSELVVQVDKNS